MEVCSLLGGLIWIIQGKSGVFPREEAPLAHTANINLPMQKSMQQNPELGRRGKIHIYVNKGNSFVIVDSHSAGKQAS